MVKASLRPTELLLMVLSGASIITVLWLATLAMLDSGVSGALAETVAAGAAYPWIKAALVDFSLMTAFVSVWIWIREANVMRRVVYIALLWTLGSAFLGAYVLLNCFRGQK